MRLLGIRSCDHDSSFCLYDSGKVKYHKVERKTGIKHDALDNLWEWEFVLNSHFGLNAEDLDEICIVFDPWRHGLGDIHPAYPAQIVNFIPNAKCRVWWMNHHLAHALSYNPFLEKESDVSIVLDGFGDKDVSWSVFRNDEIVSKGLLPSDPSFGQSYSTIADYINVRGNKHDLAGKLMGLQSYGNFDASYYESYRDKSLIEISDLRSWITHHGNDLVACGKILDWARTSHDLIYEKIFELFQTHADQNETISYVGGVALNVCWNTNLKQYYKNLKVLPHCDDSGLSIGAVEWLRKKNGLDRFSIENFPYIETDEAPQTEPSDQTIEKIANLLADGKIVGWYQGSGEIGPRALGNRSILMSPTIENGKRYINEKVKHRETYRPFGATVLKEYKNKYFYNKFDNPHMLFLDNFTFDEGLDAIRHIDNTCRIQTLGDENPNYRKLIEKFYDITGVPMLLNTSLNRGGKPICGSIRDAFGVYYETELDCLVIGNEVYEK